MKRTLALLLTFLLTFQLLAITVSATQYMSNMSTSYTLTGDPATDICRVAEAQVGKTGRQLGATEHWCADFVFSCARAAGIGEDVIPAYGGVSGLRQRVLNCGGYVVSSPQKGDLVFYGDAHVGIMIDSLYSIHGNLNGTGSGSSFYLSSSVTKCKYTAYSGNTNYIFVRPNYSSASATLVNLGDSFYASIYRADSTGERLSVADAADGTITFAAAANQSAQQRWKFTRQSDGSYKIQSTHSGYLLNVDNGSSADGTLATMWKDLGNNYQLWYIYEADGAYKLISKGTGKALTVYKASSGQNAKLYSYSGSAEQKLYVHVHSYSNETVPASCLQGGYTRVSCTACDDSYTVSDGTPAAGHSWEATGYTLATCQQLGSVTYTCSGCGETYTEQTETVWSDWSENQPASGQVESKTQYRSRDRQANWTETGSGTIQYVSSWPSGFSSSHSLYSQYNKTPKTASETGSQKTTIVSEEAVGYIYYHWCRGTYTSGPINRLISDVCEGEMTAFHAFYSTTAAGHTDANGTYVSDAFYFYNADCCRDSYWYFQIPVKQQTYRIEEKQFDGERWNEWSDWSDTAITATDDRQVETRTLYRYAQSGYADHSWDEGTVTTAPTDTAAGVRTYTCKVCGTQKTEGIPAAGAASSPFVDITTTDFYYDPVLWAVEENITNGIDATHFGPTVGCTRAHVVTFLWRSVGCPAPSSNYNPFVDVAPGSYYYDAVLWAVEKGITNGTSATTFDPDLICTRGQIVTFLWRFRNEPVPVSDENPFWDVASGQYYYNAILWAVENGITKGMGNGIFAPDDPCTRAQIVTFLYRAMNP